MTEVAERERVRSEGERRSSDMDGSRIGGRLLNTRRDSRGSDKKLMCPKIELEVRTHPSK